MQANSGTRGGAAEMHNNLFSTSHNKENNFFSTLLTPFFKWLVVPPPWHWLTSSDQQISNPSSTHSQIPSIIPFSLLQRGIPFSSSGAQLIPAPPPRIRSEAARQEHESTLQQSSKALPLARSQRSSRSAAAMSTMKFCREW